MARQNIERQKELEPERMNFAIEQLIKLGIQPTAYIKNKYIEFYFKGEKVKLFPYSGWHTGKSIKDGRGLQKLLEQIKS